MESIDPKIAAALLEEEFVVTFKCKNSKKPLGKTEFEVFLGPYLIATGTKKTRQDAREAVSSVIESTVRWLKGI